MLVALIVIACAAIVCLPVVQAAGSGCGMTAAQPENTDAEVAAKAQTTCPICAAPIDKSVFSDVEGKRVYFANAACKATFDAAPATYLEKMQKEGIVPEAIPAAPAAPEVPAVK